MSTPAMQVQSLNMNLVFSSPGSLRVPTKNPDGTILDVHTGYVLQEFSIQPSSNANPAANLPDFLSHVSAAFDTSGVTLSWTAAQATAMISLMQTNNCAGGIRLSNDGGTTTSVAAQVTIAFNQLSLNT